MKKNLVIMVALFSFLLLLTHYFINSLITHLCKVNLINTELNEGFEFYPKVILVISLSIFYLSIKIKGLFYLKNSRIVTICLMIYLGIIIGILLNVILLKLKIISQPEIDSRSNVIGYKYLTLLYVLLPFQLIFTEVIIKNLMISKVWKQDQNINE